MPRRWTGNMSGEQFLANSNPSQMEVHDLDNEQVGASQCQIDAIMQEGHDRPFRSLYAAQLCGYTPCPSCLGQGAATGRPGQLFRDDPGV